MSEFREIPGFPKYEINEEGVVRRRLPSRISSSHVGKTIKPHLSRKKGRYTINLMREDGLGKRTVYVHKLVAAAFLPPQPSPEHVVDHIDGNKRNNHASNLRWLTNPENCRSATEMGLKPRGEAHGNAVVTDELVREIRRRYASGETQMALHRELGIARTTIQAIVTRKYWKHLD